MHAEETWNSVSVSGPQSEIDRLKRLCHLPDMQVPTEDVVVDFTDLMPDSGWGECYSWNGVEYGPHEPDSFSFGFDCAGSAPVKIFERLAEEFPALSFYCSSHASRDEFMASGYFNAGSESKEFTFEEVPKGFWGSPQEGYDIPS